MRGVQNREGGGTVSTVSLRGDVGADLAIAPPVLPHTKMGEGERESEGGEDDEWRKDGYHKAELK